MLIVSVNHVAIAQTPAQDEQLFKAAYIYNFAKFTNWPDSIWQTQDDSLNICTAGSDELIIELIRLSGNMVKNHPLSIKPLDVVESYGKCHLLYIATSEKKRYKDILASISASHILTVSEITGFGRNGGIIELFREENRTRFIINLTAARQAGLVISSHLLILADVIGNGMTP